MPLVRHTAAVLFVASALPALLALQGCSRASIRAEAPPALAVEAATLQPDTASSAASAAGALKRRREMTLSFRIPGVMTRIAVDDGDRVRRGQLLATLDPTTVESQLARARAELDRARRDTDRLAGLVEKGAVSRQQYEAQRTALEAAEAAYRSADFDRRWASLVSPVDGVVLLRSAQAGEVVQPGQAVLSVADDGSPLVLRVPLADRDAVRVRMGQPARVRLDALPDEPLAGQVSRIAERAGAASGAIDVEVTIPERPGLRSGMIGRADFDVASPSTGSRFARIPAEAVLEAAGSRAFVFRIEGGRARRTQVAFGGFDGDFARVGGLSPGDRVVTAGAGYVADGQRVSVIDPARVAGPAR